MVTTVGPGKFYGSSLPRPRYYSNVKHSDQRVDPPVPVMDALMTWAHDAHWSMGGQSFTRCRLQGRIEGNVDKLRVQREKQEKEKSPEVKSSDKRKRIVDETPSPVAIKRRRVVGVVEDDDDDEEEDLEGKSGAVRKLGDDFESMASDLGKIKKGKKKLFKAGGKEMAETAELEVEVKRDLGEIKKGKKKLVKGGGKEMAEMEVDVKKDLEENKKGNKKLVKGVGKGVLAAAEMEVDAAVRIRSSPRLVKRG